MRDAPPYTIVIADRDADRVSALAAWLEKEEYASSPVIVHVWEALTHEVSQLGFHKVDVVVLAHDLHFEHWTQE